MNKKKTKDGASAKRESTTNKTSHRKNSKGNNAEARMHSCMRFFLSYNDHFVTIVNMELFILYLLSKRLDEVEWRSD